MTTQSTCEVVAVDSAFHSIGQNRIFDILPAGWLHQPYLNLSAIKFHLNAHFQDIGCTIARPWNRSTRSVDRLDSTKNRLTPLTSSTRFPLFIGLPVFIFAAQLQSCFSWAACFLSSCLFVYHNHVGLLCYYSVCVIFSVKGRCQWAWNKLDESRNLHFWTFNELTAPYFSIDLEHRIFNTIIFLLC